MAGRGNGRILLQNFRAMRHNPFLYSHYEEHVRVHCDGIGIHSDGLRSGPDALPFPEFYARGLFAIYQLLEAMLPELPAPKPKKNSRSTTRRSEPGSPSPANRPAAFPCRAFFFYGCRSAAVRSSRDSGTEPIIIRQ